MTNDLNGEAFVSFAKAGLDTEFTLFKIYTRKLTDTKTGEVGYFDFKCRDDLGMFELRPDPVGYLKYLVREYVKHGIEKTGVPIEAWIVEFSPIMERYTIPSHLFLDTTRDRSWLA